MNDELLYQVALTMVHQIGDVHGRLLVNTCGSASAVFKTPLSQLERIEGIGTLRARQIKSFRNFSLCDKELNFIAKYSIIPMFFTDADYPRRLLACYDAPLMIYFRGNADLNHKRIISIVGTRNNSEYGKICCEKLVEELRSSDILVVSGLAFGIDTIAHKTSLKHDIPTVAVVAHGLDRIYPSENKSLARQMITNGGLLTDFRTGTKPDRQNFPRRNRIVAGICDALIVLESGSKGGSLITADIANSYNKDVLAYPGRAGDAKSEGCNSLIRLNKAALITSAADVMETMGWMKNHTPLKPTQIELFTELSASEKIIAGILLQSGALHVDQLCFRAELHPGSVASSLLSLEMKGIVTSMPGKIYKLS